MPLSFKDIQAADKDWPKWLLPGVILLAVLGGVFEASGQNPVVAVVGLAIIAAIFIPIRLRQLDRRLAERKARKGDDGRI